MKYNRFTRFASLTAFAGVLLICTIPASAGLVGTTTNPTGVTGLIVGGNIYDVTLGWRCHPKGATRGLPPRTQRLVARHLPFPWLAAFRNCLASGSVLAELPRRSGKNANAVTAAQKRTLSSRYVALVSPQGRTRLCT